MVADSQEKADRNAHKAPLIVQDPIRFRSLVRICAIFVAVVGFVSLLGWVLELPVLATLGSSNIPVAPSTAVMFVLYAVAIFLRSRLPESRVSYRAGVSINITGALIAALLFVLSLLNIQTKAEHLGFSAVYTPGELQIGHMSLITAAGFLLSSLSYLLSLPFPRARRWAANIAWWLACCIIATGSMLALAYLYGTPMLYGSVFIPPAALTSLAFMALGTALLALAARHAWRSRANFESSTRATYTFILVFVFLAAGIMLAGFLYYRNYEKQYRTEVEHQLSAIADLKVGDLVSWRKERLGDAVLFYKNDNFSALVRRYLQNPEDEETATWLRTWLQHVRKRYHYDRVFLIDARGHERMAEPEARRQISRHVVLRAAEVLRTKQVVFEDFYRNEYDGRVYLTVLVPILDERGNGRAIGTLAFRVDPQEDFYPSIVRWPTPSKTAETLLVRREGNEVLFLNELRFKKNTALNLRISLDQKDSPAAQSVLGRQGVMEGRDYRGVPVIADMRPVPGSPWFLVSRMDISEVYEPLKEKLWLMVALVGALLMGAGGSVGLVWRRQRTEFYRERYMASEALRESEAQFRTLADSIPNLAWWANVDGYITWYNQRWYEYTGTAPEQMEGWGWQSVHDSKMLPKVLERWTASIATGEPFDMEFPLRGADGVFRPFLTRVLPLKDSAGQVLRWFGTNTDISTLKQVEEKIRRLNEELEQRVTERTAQLEAANKELESFSYSVSHDLRAPLRAVDGFTGILLEKYGSSLDAEGQRICSVISESARDMGKLIDDLLAFSRVGRTAMQLSPVDIATMARSIFFEATTPEARERIDFHVGPLPNAVGDPTLLRQVWMNLLSNAIKFSSKKERAVIEVSAGQRGNETVYIVRDNGAGFDMQYVDKLFGVFQRLHSTKEFEGTGVGLAIVQRIIVRHGGRVWAEGESGKGATLYFTVGA